MGNKFKLSDMIPNAWFHKLKDMSKTRKKTSNNNNPKNIKKKPTLSPPITTTTTTKTTINNKPQYHHPPQEPPRKSSKRRSTSSSSRRRKPVFKPHSRFVSSSSESEVLSENDEAFLRLSSSTADIIIDLETYEVKRGQNRINNDNNYDINNVNVDLPPILTKPINFDDTIFEATKDFRSRTKTTTKNSANSSSSSTKSFSVEIVKEERTVHKQKTRHSNDNQKKCSSSSSSVTAGIRLRANSPRLASRTVQACTRKSVSYSRNKQYLSESLAVIKSSVDPQRDFRDSMVEMIVENNIRASKDLEDLLACYLSLNSKEYHDVIVKAFEQIWFDMADIRI